MGPARATYTPRVATAASSATGPAGPGGSPGPGSGNSSTRSVQFVDEPPRPCTNTAGCAPAAAGAVRTNTSPAVVGTRSPGQAGIGSAVIARPGDPRSWTGLSFRS